MPKEWKDKFERTVGLLPRGDWGKVTLKKARVRVNDVAAGLIAKFGERNYIF